MARFETVETFRVLSKPYTCGPLNGCLPCEVEREEFEIEIVRDTQYGLELAFGRSRIVGTTSVGPWGRGFVESTPARVAAWRAARAPAP